VVITIPPVVVVPPVTTQPTPTQPLPQNNDSFSETDFAQIGVVYNSEYKTRLLLPNRENGNSPQMMKVTDSNGNLVYGFNRVEGWRAESEYWGNHGRETQFPVRNGRYKVEFENRDAVEKHIVGYTRGDMYSFYDVKGQLALTDHWQQVLPNSRGEFYIDINESSNKRDLLNNWDSKNPKVVFMPTIPFYENGNVTTDQVLALSMDASLYLGEYGTDRVKFYKEHNPSANITIEFTRNGKSVEPTFKVIEKNGLDICPKYTMLTCWNVDRIKVFNNNSIGYVDRP
jgi:hypothetical protein